jgi:hypothetical protein
MRTKIIAISLFITLLCLGNLPKLFANTNNQLIITEIGNHELSELEWIEIFNNSNANIDLTGLIFREEGVNHRTTLFQGANTLEPNKYAIIANNAQKFKDKYSLVSQNQTILDSSWTTLSNQGELLELIKNSQTLESFIYSSNTLDTSLERINRDYIYVLEFQNHPDSHSLFSKSYASLFAETTTDTNTEQPASNPVIEEPVSEPNTPIEPIFQPEPTIEQSNQTNTPENSTSNSDPVEPPITETTTVQNPNLPAIQTNTNQTIVYEEVITYIEHPFVLISELSFNSTPDWLEIFIDPRDSEVNLANIQLQIDNKLIPIGLTGKINQPSFIVVDTDLVATTEQVSVVYNSKIYDSVCWENSSPTLAEVADKDLLIELGQWEDLCLDSNNLNKNETFFRTNFLPDSNLSTDFKKTIQSSKGNYQQTNNSAPTAIIEIQSGNLTGEIPLSLNLDGSKSTDPDGDSLTYEWNFNGTKINKPNPDSYKFETTGFHPVSLTVTDSEGNTSISSLTIFTTNTKSTSTTSTSQSTSSNSNKTVLTAATNSTSTNSINQSSTTNNGTKSNIQISSFIPNPKGADTETEWIEITNFDSKTIQLDNYYLDDEEGGSKPFSLKDITLKPAQKTQIKITDSKISLGNTKDSVRLIFGNEVIEEVYFESAKDNEIFQKVNSDWTRNTQTTSNSTTTKSSTDVSSSSDSKVELASANTDAATTSKEAQTTPTTLKANLIKPANQTSASKSTIPNGTLSDKIAINEVLPNPKSTDKGQEWIELKNFSDKDVQLGNWKIKLNTKLYPLENVTIPANGFYLVQSDKLSIPNSNLNIELLDYINQIVDKFKIESSKEGQSTFKIRQHYEWTTEPTPKAENPERILIEGTITNLDLNSQTFILIDNYNKQQKILFQKNLTDKLANQAKITGSGLKDKDGNTILQLIENIELPVEEKSKSKKILWTLLIPFIAIPLYLYKDKLKEIGTYIISQK